jgi:hypothetical protein
MASTRRLAAIFAADAVGYSRLMREDEEGTHERFKAHRRELVDPKIRQHHGRLVKYTGDGMLAEFPSVVEAVLCAVEVQCGMSHRNVGVPDHERISFRIGVNVGDVIAEPEDIYGDGVNIAARLEALAEPNALDAVDARTLTEAAQSLGAGPGRALIAVIVPNIMSGVLNGGLLVFSTVFAEFTLANLLVGSRFKTFPIYLVEFTRFDARQASALAVISFIIAWVTSLGLIWVGGRGGRPRMN